MFLATNSLLLAALLTAAPLPAAPDAGRAETVAAMHAALQAVLSLQPYLASPEDFRSPANRALIEGDLELLALIRHRFVVPKKEPGAAALAGMFGQQISAAKNDFKWGYTEGARLRLRGVSALCFACHSREAVTVDFQDAAKVVDALQLPLLRRAEFFANTRQFDQAISTWKQALATAPGNDLEKFDQAAALRQCVAVLVRVKDDAPATVALLTEQSARTDLEGFVSRAIAGWLKGAKAWEAEKFRAVDQPPAALFARAKALLEQSGAASSLLTDDARFIGLLRASGYLHLALDKDPTARFRGEGLYLLGVASADSLDPLLWELDGLYLEACIRENAHTPLARKCVTRMVDRTWLAWTGSGSRIPWDVGQRLGELRALAQQQAQ